MALPRSWKDLLPGVVTLCALGTLAVGVIALGGVGTMHGSKVTLYGTVSSTSGLIKGSEVWLVGQKVGAVQEIEYRGAATDTAERILIALEVLEKDLLFIRRGATIDIHPGGNLIGAPVVSINSGLTGQPAVRDGDTLRSAPTAGRKFQRTRADFAVATQGLPLVVGNLRLLSSQLRSTHGTLGAFGIGGGSELSEIAKSVNRLLSTTRAGSGTIGLVMGGGAAQQKAAVAMARLDTLRLLITGPGEQGPIGRFRRDSTLPATIASVRADLAEVATLLDQPSGTASRVQRDSALVQQVRRGRVELAALAADVKRNPLRYFTF